MIAPETGVSDPMIPVASPERTSTDASWSTAMPTIVYGPESALIADRGMLEESLDELGDRHAGRRLELKLVALAARSLCASPLVPLGVDIVETRPAFLGSPQS